MLVATQAIHTCAVRFPDVAGSVLHLLCDFLSDTNTASALDVIYFIREIIQVRPSRRWRRQEWRLAGAWWLAVQCQRLNVASAMLAHGFEASAEAPASQQLPTIKAHKGMVQLPACLLQLHSSGEPLACLVPPPPLLRRPTPSCTTPSSSG